MVLLTTDEIDARINVAQYFTTHAEMPDSLTYHDVFPYECGPSPLEIAIYHMQYDD